MSHLHFLWPIYDGKMDSATFDTLLVETPSNMEFEIGSFSIPYDERDNVLYCKFLAASKSILSHSQEQRIHVEKGTDLPVNKD